MTKMMDAMTTNKNTHILKTWPEYYEQIENGNKTFEIRLNDRDYRVGDTLILKEFCPEKKIYTGRYTSVNVTYITNFNQLSGYVVMGFQVSYRVSSSYQDLVDYFNRDFAKEERDWMMSLDLTNPEDVKKYEKYMSSVDYI